MADRQALLRTPCVGICEIGDDALCRGCLRTLAEIGEWGRADRVRRGEILDLIDARRRGPARWWQRLGRR